MFCSQITRQMENHRACGGYSGHSSAATRENCVSRTGIENLRVYHLAEEKADVARGRPIKGTAWLTRLLVSR
ncbi:Uncharacterized protein dnm_036600 [Desulfonema magnum]|uniref:Uncharacterized protein n=1 Tax=Desulfonema magnum TaxID=45655 RepID=A0A975GNC8_9BACT|nr:Uncharacterized protein dnm_036600 [Desulfonema magnum]